MHKKLLFLASGALLLLASCSSDDGSAVAATEADLEGTWNFVATSGRSTSSFDFMGTTSTTIGETVGTNFDYQMTFTVDPNEVTVNGSYTVNVKSNTDGTEFTDDLTVNHNNKKGTWTLDGDTLTMDIEFENTETSQGFAGDFRITEITGSSLKMAQNVNKVIDQTEGGITISNRVQGDFNHAFTKVKEE